MELKYDPLRHEIIRLMAVFEWPFGRTLPPYAVFFS